MKGEKKASSQISDKEFMKWRNMIRERTNICLNNNQHDFLERRLLKRMNSMSIQNFQEYYDVVKHEKPQREWPIISDDEFVRLCPKGTRRRTALAVRRIVQL